MASVAAPGTAPAPHRPLPARRRRPRRRCAPEGHGAPARLPRPSLRAGKGGRRAALTLCAGADLGHRFLHRRHRCRAGGRWRARLLPRALHLPHAGARPAPQRSPGRGRRVPAAAPPAARGGRLAPRAAPPAARAAAPN